MKTIQELKKEQQTATDQLLTDCKIFFAFNDQQFKEGLSKTPLAEGEKLVSIGAGGYMPKSQVKNFTEGMERINKEYKAAIKANKQRKESILYELRNTEAFYTCDIEDACNILGPDYTREEVQQVYNANREKEQETI